jgi:hypothetical protein
LNHFEKQWVEDVFTYHMPNLSQIERYESLRAGAKVLAQRILRFSAASLERQKALDRLREAIMWANASIALEPKPIGAEEGEGGYGLPRAIVDGQEQVAQETPRGGESQYEPEEDDRTFADKGP